jgi:hypothetical protein
MSIVATFVGIVMTNPKVLYYLKHIVVLKVGYSMVRRRETCQM